MATRGPLSPTATGCRVAIRVVPRARRSAIEGLRDGALLVRLAAPPVEGAANAALIDLLAEVLGVPRSAVRVTNGTHHRNKVVDVTGCTHAQAATRLGLTEA